MEKINLHNYEAFFLDYSEGNLDSVQVQELMDFLKENPALQSELEDSFEGIELVPAFGSELDKSFLKKEGIQKEEVEELMIASIEGQLSKEQEYELTQYVTDNSLQKTFAYYKNTILVPNVAETYGNKSRLKKGDAVLNLLGDGVVEVEELMIASIEGQLTKEQEVQLSTYVTDNSLHKTFAFYKNTILVPNVLETYGNKSDLKKRDALIIPIGYRIAAAAAVVVLFFGLYLNNNLSGEGALLDEVQTAEVKEPNQFYPKETLPNTNSNSRLTNLETIQNPNHSENNFIAEKDQKQDIDPSDSIKVQPVKIDQEELIPNNIADRDSIETTIPTNVFKEDDVAIVESKKDNIVSEEPIKFITNLAGNVFNKDVSYQRDKNTESDQYVAHHFTLGRFEFERKKH